MDNTIDDFFIELQQEVIATSEVHRTSSSEAFLEMVSQEIAATGSIDDDVEYCHYTPIQGGMRIDGYTYDMDEKILSLFIVDYESRPKVASLTLTDMNVIFKRLVNFFEASIKKRLCPKLEVTSDEYKLAKMIGDQHAFFIKINLFLVSERKLSTRVKNLESKNICDTPAYFHVWDIGRLFQQHLSKGQRETLDLDFKDYDIQGIPCLKANFGSDACESYLAIVPGNLLASLYERYDSRLLEQNVRTFLQARGKVNKGIRATILGEPSMFFAYNNGLTATAQHVEVESERGAMVISRIRDLQIVNGGQTTASLFHTRRKDKASLDQIFVQMKLSIVGPTQSEHIVPKISEYANTQNKVTAADFFANHPFHLEIEKFSRRILAPAQTGKLQETKWFYERARGQYAEAQSKLKPSEKNIFLKLNPKKQMFTKEDMAKYENVWEEHPKYLSRGRQKNFVQFAERIKGEWNNNENSFNDLFFKRAVARAIIFRETERIVSSQPWYRPGGSLRSHLVYYSLACLAEIARKRRKEIHFMEIWKHQEVPKALIDAIATAATFINEHVTSPTDSHPRDSEWFKKDICWNFLKSELDHLEAKLASVMDSLFVRPSNEPNIVAGVKFQEEVLKIPVAHWKQIIEKLYPKKMLNEKELGILTIASQIPKKLPSEKQSQILLQILEKARSEGVIF